MYIFVLLVCLASVLQAAVKVSPLIEKVSDHKDLKKLLRTRSNVLVLYTKSATSGDSKFKLLSDVAQVVKGQGTIAWVNCGDSEGRKLCKKVKVDPSSKSGGYAKCLLSLSRAPSRQSMVAFLKDPTGAPLWEENPEAKDIVHVETEKVSTEITRFLRASVMSSVIFPTGCGVCKRMQPVFQQAATETKGKFVLAGMNVHPAEFDGLKQEYNVKGYPTFCYFEKGKFRHHYENYGGTAKDITDWMKNPQPPQPKVPEVQWSETDSPVFHLTDDSFDGFLAEHPSVLIMFYAPWCGHCKKMKPEYEEAAEYLKDTNSPGVLAAVDTTIHKAVGDRFKISGFPTVKYFEKGEEKFTLPHLRSKDKIIEYLQNPQAPPPPEQSWEDKPSGVSHLGMEDFREVLKKKKHALVMFYAPWCPHCKNAVPHFTTAADLFKEDRKIAYVAVDCTKGQNQELCKQESVEGYPTFNYYNYGKFAEKYNGDRGEAGFIGFMRSLRGRDQGKRKEEL
uniref:Protein disulfide isomerase family A, member 5 n=1 Tax=Oncorhynchus mykiss TaxID=8022 RepID=A0A8C7M357_ONCMY